MTGKQSLRANNIRAVTEAALDLFYKNGIDGTTITDIAKQAGVSRMSVLRYFENKADIVSAATDELFKYVDDGFKLSDFSDDTDTLTGMQLAKNYLGVYRHLIDVRPRFLNYLCEVAFFYSKQGVAYEFPRFNILEEHWNKALLRGMADKTITAIKNYEDSQMMIHNMFMGISLRMYLINKNLSSPDTAAKLKAQTERMTDMVIKYLAP